MIVTSLVFKSSQLCGLNMGKCWRGIRRSAVAEMNIEKTVAQYPAKYAISEKTSNIIPLQGRYMWDYLKFLQSDPNIWIDRRFQPFVLPYQDSTFAPHIERVPSVEKADEAKDILPLKEFYHKELVKWSSRKPKYVSPYEDESIASCHCSI